jgi:hypothetical protein
MSDQRHIPGNEISWGSIKAYIDNQPYTGLTSMAGGDKRERTYGYGLGPAHGPSRRSKGKYTPEPLKVTGFKSSVQIIRQALADKSDSGRAYGDVVFDVVEQFVEGDFNITVEYLECVWIENAASHEENPDPLKEDFVVMPMRVKRNGLVLYDNSNGDP